MVEVKPDVTCPKCKTRFMVKFYSRLRKGFEFMQPMYCPVCGHKFGWAKHG